VIKISDELFEAIYNEEILAEIEARFGPFQQAHFKLSPSTPAMLDLVTKWRERKFRRGEVVMVVPDESNRIWLHTKPFYPQGVYRLMTGGLDTAELPHQALHREVWEETGCEVDIERCLAVLTYSVAGNGAEMLPFVSYIFLTTPGHGAPHPTDTGEAISDFQAVSPETLPEIAHQLRSLQGEFKDWGIFRAIAHQVTAKALGQNGQA